MTATPIYDAAQAAKARSAWSERAKARNQERLAAMTPVLVELADGPPVWALKANLVTLFEAGRVPDPLSPFVWDMIRLGQEAAPKTTEAAIIANWTSWLKVLDTVWFATVVDPEFFMDVVPADPDQPGSVAVTLPVPPGMEAYSEVTLNDKLSLFNWCQGVADHLAAFRAEATGTARAVDDKSGVPEVHAG